MINEGLYKIKGVFKRLFKGTKNQLNFTVSIHTSVKQNTLRTL